LSSITVDVLPFDHVTEIDAGAWPSLSCVITKCHSLLLHSWSVKVLDPTWTVVARATSPRECSVTAEAVPVVTMNAVVRKRARRDTSTLRDMRAPQRFHQTGFDLEAVYARRSPHSG
jgi:hypothetical protein